MAEQTPDIQGPGAIRRALFQEVPFILDSLWRRAEFTANRLGSVDFDAPHHLKPRPTWKSAAFLLYALVALYLVFGPTADSLCALSGFDAALKLRKAASIALAVVAAAIFLFVLNSVTQRLTQAAEESADAQCRKKPELLAQRQRISNAIARANAAMPKSINQGADRVSGNLFRFLGAMGYLSARDTLPLVITLVVLSFGALLVAAPVGVMAYAFYRGELDPMSCSQLENPRLVIAQFCVYAGMLLAGFFIWRRLMVCKAIHACAALTAVLGAGIALLWFVFMPQHPSEAVGGFYPHAYLVIVGALSAMALFAWLLARIIFSRVQPADMQPFRAGLANEDLINLNRPQPEISMLRLAAAVVNGVSGNLLHFLLLPAFVAFIAPTDWMYWLTLTFTVVSVFLLMWGNLSSRWEQMLVYVERWFLVGTPLVLSIGVIAVAIMRLLDVQYVATVLDATPVGVLFIFVVMMYSALWYFEYWANRWVSERLLEVLDTRKQACHAYIPCPFKPAADARSGQFASAEGRYIAVHGTGRFIAQGWRMDDVNPSGQPDHPEVAFTTYSLVELFDVLGRNQKGGPEAAHDIRRRVHLYFILLNIALIASAWGLDAWHKNWSRPLVVEPMVRANAIKPEAVPDVTQQAAQPSRDPLAERLLAQTAAGRPSLVVAASGGGTRAAVYSAVGLAGMAQIDRARDVVLLSGVSGGGVSAAVFASRFAELSTGDPRTETVEKPGAWMRYTATVSQPFIQDVLEGVGELRIAGSWSLGALLQESLERRAFAPTMTPVRTFGELANPALILNTAISGHPYSDSELLRNRVAAPRSPTNCLEQSRPYANLAGGRLIFTNLTNVSGFPEPSRIAPDLWLPYRVVNDGSVPLAAASALTANFPPVFSNARVRLRTAGSACEGQSYFVTDGGAVENLGLVSALFALRGTLAGLAPDARLTDIHLLAFEASAIDYDYSDDRGIGAATGGSKERINSGLTQVLLKELGTLAGEHGAALRVHYLPLPVAFRSRGGFGTHWMFARTVTVLNPLLADAPDTSDWLPGGDNRDEVDLDRGEVMTTLRAMFDPERPLCLRAQGYVDNLKDAPIDWTADVQKVTRWICGHDDARRARKPVLPDYQVEAWATAVAELKAAR